MHKGTIVPIPSVSVVKLYHHLRDKLTASTAL